MMHCLNCETELKGTYCHSCGQKGTFNRLTVNNILSTSLDSLFNLKKGFFFTLKNLILNPGSLIQSYISGKRKTYYNPFKFLILLTTFSNILLLKIISYGSFKPLNNLIIKIEGETVFNLSKYWDSLTLFMVPIFSFLSFILFKSKNFNFAENLALNSYLIGFQSFINIIYFIIFLLIAPEITPPGIPYLIGFLFIIYSNIKFFKVSFLEGIIKSILIVILGYSIFTQFLDFLNFILSIYFNLS